MQCNHEGKNRQPNVEPMFRALLDIMRYDPPTVDIATARRLAKGMVEKFLERFAEEEDFCRYFKAQWADEFGALLELSVKYLDVSFLELAAFGIYFACCTQDLN